VSDRSARCADEQRRSLEAQRAHWERVLPESADQFGADASDPARAAARRLRPENLTRVLELGAGQGRDTLLLAEQGFDVHALDYADSGVAAIRRKLAAAGLNDQADATRHVVRGPLPFGTAASTPATRTCSSAWR
jgi:cyclopropane fatty-acyl-phospholipid synthase-like methyltransferase